MIEEKTPTCLFENEIVTFKSYSDEFTSKLYEEYDLKAKNLGLDFIRLATPTTDTQRLH